MHLARCLLVALAVAAPSRAAVFTVNSTADTTDGTCAVAADGCTLREAIEAAVATPGRDTIRFDPALFVRGELSSPINLTTSLPVISDGAGTAIDGSGATVLINGGPGIGAGLVFGSAPGAPLSGVAVANVRLSNFETHALWICGGVPPDCDGDVRDAAITEVTTIAAAGDGIRIEGATVTRPTLRGVVAYVGQSWGVELLAQTLAGARVEGCTARGNAFGGFLLSAPRADGVAVVDTVAVANVGRGIDIRTDDGARISIVGSVATGNGDDGILVFSEATLAKTAVAGSCAVGNGGNGVEILAALEASATSVSDVAAVGNVPHGLELVGPHAKARLERVTAVDNQDGGVALLDAAIAAPRVRDVTTVGNNEGIYLRTNGARAKGILAGDNADIGIFVLEPAARNSITRSVSLANNTGIALRDPSTENTVRGNLALDNLSLDLQDANVDCGSNTWAANEFVEGDPECVE